MIEVENPAGGIGIMADKGLIAKLIIRFMSGLVIYFVVRTALEDKVLHNELEGYKEYAQRTKYRLVPGIW